LVIFRLILGPTLLILALRLPTPGIWLGFLFVLGPVSDIFDGVLARRFGTATSRLRISDTAVDTVFYIMVLAAVVELDWIAIRDRIVLIVAVIALETVRHVFDLAKFRRIASYHTYSAKIWGLLLMLAVGALLCFRRGAWLLTVALVWGILSELEGLTFSILLPQWVHDVKTLPRALAIRRELEKKKTACIPAR
jgi:CDP-diacylglycerol--glycerol-3-phosphate 3-phosphatidyltransferase